MKKIFSVANICLFVIALVLTVGAALIVMICGGDRISCFMTGAFAGIIGTMIVGALSGLLKWDFVDSPAAGLIATMVGMALNLFII